MPNVIKLENKTARILHVSLGGGKSVPVPPVEGGITLKLTDSEKEDFDANLATETVQEWIAAGDLVVTEKAPKLGDADADADADEEGLDDEGE